MYQDLQTATESAAMNNIYSSMSQGYPDVLSVKQVGEILNLSNKTVYRILNDDTLNSLKIGRAFKIPKLYVLQYIKVLNLSDQN